MSPEPYVRAHALVLALVLVAASVLAPAAATLTVASVGALAAWGLRGKYRRDVAVARAEIPPHRERLDRIVAGDAQAAYGMGLAAAGVLTGFDVTPPGTGLSLATPVLVAVAATAVHLSSLTDWYVILPRMTGLLGARPCRSEHGEHPGFPRTWRETTRWWYIHRTAAALVLRTGLALAGGLTVDKYVSLPGGGTVVVAAALGGLASYAVAVPRGGWQAGHLTMVVGRTVRRQETRRLPRRLKRVPIGEPGEREYVYDVALEGVDLVPADSREDVVPRDEHGQILFERDPIKVPLKQVDYCVPAEFDFSGCRGRCSGINWYCIENPRCFEPK